MAGFVPEDSYGSCLVVVDDIGAIHGEFAPGCVSATARQDRRARLDGALDPNGSAHDLDGTATAGLRDARQAVADRRQSLTNDNAGVGADGFEPPTARV